MTEKMQIEMNEENFKAQNFFETHLEYSKDHPCTPNHTPFWVRLKVLALEWHVPETETTDCRSVLECPVEVTALLVTVIVVKCIREIVVIVVVFSTHNLTCNICNMYAHFHRKIRQESWVFVITARFM